MVDILPWLEQHSSAVQGISTVILLVITGIYAWLTRRIATGTELMARQAEVQRLDTSRPVILFGLEIEPWDLSNPYLRFALKLINGGYGPALDVRVRADLPGFKATPLLQPFALPAADSTERKYWVRAREFDERQLIGGKVEVSYRDVHGRYFGSEVPLTCEHPPEGKGGPQLGVTTLTGPHLHPP